MKKAPQKPFLRRFSPCEVTHKLPKINSVFVENDRKKTLRSLDDCAYMQ